MPGLCDGVDGHIQKILKNSRAYCEGVAYRKSGTAALRPLTGNPEDGVGSEAEDAWDAGWGHANAGSGILGCCADPGSWTEDATPAAYTFTEEEDAETETEYTSESVIPTGYNVTVAITVADGTYSINGMAFTSSAGEFSPGDAVRLKHESSASAETAVVTTVTIGGIDGTFTSTTAAA